MTLRAENPSAVWPLLWALNDYNQRKVCYCGAPLGHTGWLVCFEKARA